MPFLSLSFLLGDILLQLQYALPAIKIVVFFWLCGCCLALARHRSYLYLLAAAFILGFSWTAWYAQSLLRWQLPREWEGKPLTLHGTVSSLPAIDKFGIHFLMDIHSIQKRRMKINAHTTVRLSWPQAKSLRVGDQYELHARLRRIHGMRNPGGFDYEAHALQSRLRASGSVITSMPQKLLGHCYTCSPVNQLRQMLRDRILQYLPTSETSPWLLALMIGDRSLVSPPHWQILRATGTNHLMAVAGLHIGIIAGFIHILVRWIWKRSAKLCESYPAPLAGAIAALLAALLYSMLAGFSIPTQRACIMLSFFIAASLARHQLPPWHAWSAALLTVLLLDPLTVLSESFWLSFGTIALIIYGMNGRLAPVGIWWKWGRVQWVIGVGLIPLSLMFFRETSLVSVLVNSIAIPWLGFLVLPFCLLSNIFLFVWPPLGVLLLWIADKSLAGLWYMLGWFANLDFAVWTHAMPSYWLLALSVIGILLLLLPAGKPGRWLGIIWLLPVMLHQPQTIAQGDFNMTTLDVGQGLSVVISTANHTLVFDAGPKFGDQFDMGESVVVPFLQTTGVRLVDQLVISHGDIDHLGGASAIIRALPVRSILTSAVEKFPSRRAHLCLAGMGWRWDGVNFRVLYPYRESLRLGNDSSCVLRISNGRHSVLLTGDIEKFAEKQLLLNSYHEINVDVLTAPHHGSKTSSHKAFVHAVAPNYVVFATGYRNRYHFPHAAVVRNYTSQHTSMLNTANSGAIQFQMKRDNALINPNQYRITEHHYWSD